MVLRDRLEDLFLDFGRLLHLRHTSNEVSPGHKQSSPKAVGPAEDNVSNACLFLASPARLRGPCRSH